MIEKSMTFSYEHEKFGLLKISIIGKNPTTEAIIKPDFVKKYGKLQTQEFLHALYTNHIGNDNLSDIIGEQTASLSSKLFRKSMPLIRQAEPDTFPPRGRLFCSS